MEHLKQKSKKYRVDGQILMRPSSISFVSLVDQGGNSEAFTALRKTTTREVDPAAGVTAKEMDNSDSGFLEQGDVGVLAVRLAMGSDEAARWANDHGFEEVVATRQADGTTLLAASSAPDLTAGIEVRVSDDVLMYLAPITDAAKRAAQAAGTPKGDSPMAGNKPARRKRADVSKPPIMQDIARMAEDGDLEGIRNRLNYCVAYDHDSHEFMELMEASDDGVPPTVYDILELMNVTLRNAMGTKDSAVVGKVFDDAKAVVLMIFNVWNGRPMAATENRQGDDAAGAQPGSPANPQTSEAKMADENKRADEAAQDENTEGQATPETGKADGADAKREDAQADAQPADAGAGDDATPAGDTGNEDMAAAMRESVAAMREVTEAVRTVSDKADAATDAAGKATDAVAKMQEQLAGITEQLEGIANRVAKQDTALRGAPKGAGADEAAETDTNEAANRAAAHNEEFGDNWQNNPFTPKQKQRA